MGFPCCTFQGLNVVFYTIINSTRQWPWFTHNLFLILFSLFCSKLILLILSRSPDFLITFSTFSFSLSPLLNPSIFISLDAPCVLPHSLHHFAPLHHEWIVRLSSPCLCASPVCHPQWPLKLPRRNWLNVCSTLKSCIVDREATALSLSMSKEK